MSEFRSLSMPAQSMLQGKGKIIGPVEHCQEVNMVDILSIVVKAKEWWNNPQSQQGIGYENQCCNVKS